jgi:hypothetical protein
MTIARVKKSAAGEKNALHFWKNVWRKINEAAKKRRALHAQNRHAIEPRAPCFWTQKQPPAAPDAGPIFYKDADKNRQAIDEKISQTNSKRGAP